MSIQTSADTYNQYLTRGAAALSKLKFAHLDAVETRMLSILASRWHENTPITVLEAMVMLPEISTTTAHRQVTFLRKKGVIDLVPNEEDRRIKYIVPTKGTLSYFAQFGKCMGGPKTVPADCARQYIKFIYLREEVRGQLIYQKMNATDFVMLDTWAVVWHEEVPMGVLEASALIKGRCRISVLSRLHGLRAKGLIDLVTDDQNRRTKYVVPTKAANDYFAQLGKCIHKALSS